MIKQLFFMAALLVPGLAYGGNPSADLQVQIVPAGSPPVPAAAQAANFTTLALNSDFTSAFYANRAHWLDCAGATNPIWYNVVYGVGPAPCSNYAIIQDPVYGGQVLSQKY